MLLCCMVPISHAAPLPDDALSAAALREALHGGSIGHRGILREGEAAAVYAQGYIEGVAASEAHAGRWCGAGKIKPHELWSHIYEKLEAPALQNQAADQAVAQILQQLYPCKR